MIVAFACVLVCIHGHTFEFRQRTTFTLLSSRGHQQGTLSDVAV